MLNFLQLTFFLTLAAVTSFAQGVTTASISGVVRDSKGEPLPGCNIVAIHIPSGTLYGTSARTDGGFNIPNVRIGGPYKVTASFVGYNSHEKEGISLSLGVTYNMDFDLTETGTELQQVVVSAS